MGFEWIKKVVDVDEKWEKLSRNEEQFNKLEKYLKQEKNQNSFVLWWDIKDTIKEINKKASWLDENNRKEFLEKADKLVDDALKDYIDGSWVFLVMLDDILPKNDAWKQAGEYIKKKEQARMQVENHDSSTKSDSVLNKLWRFFLWDTTVDNIQRRNDPSSLLEWWTKVKY